MATKKQWTEPEDFGVWDTSVTDPPPADREAGPEEVDLLAADPEPPGKLKAKRGKDKEPAAPAPTPRVPPSAAPGMPPSEMFDLGPTYTTIGPTLVIRGRLKCDENLVVAGRMEANVESKRVLRVEPTGIVNANIDVKAAWIGGIVVGDIRASELVELAPDARVVGDIATPRLIVHDGARFRGEIEMDGLQALELVKPKPKVTAAAAVAASTPAKGKAAKAAPAPPPPEPVRPAEVEWSEGENEAPAPVVAKPVPTPAAVRPNPVRIAAPPPPVVTVQADLVEDEEEEEVSQEPPPRVEVPPPRARPRGVQLPPVAAVPPTATASGGSGSASGAPPHPVAAPEPPPSKTGWFGRRG